MGASKGDDSRWKRPKRNGSVCFLIVCICLSVQVLEMLRHLLVGYLFAGLSSQAPLSRCNHSAPLKFKPDGTFQLSIFEDLHFGENAWDQWGPQQDINSVQVLNKVLDFDRPDLVVLNGDLIT